MIPIQPPFLGSAHCLLWFGWSPERCDGSVWGSLCPLAGHSLTCPLIKSLAAVELRFYDLNFALSASLQITVQVMAALFEME